jgi:hypothetical protein
MRVTRRQPRQRAGRSLITTQRGNGEDQDWNSLVRGWREGTGRDRRANSRSSARGWALK